MVKPNFYRDSLQLMKISDKLHRVSTGITQASVVMATETNKGILIRLGFSPSTIEQARESDMLIAVSALDQKDIDMAIAKLDSVFESQSASDSGEQGNISDLDSALRAIPAANLALISIPGEYVKDISHKLIESGVHQQIFSDHVPVEDELELKTAAAERGILIMGPGAGTSIINGKGIGFSNAISRGPVGIVAAAGTGLQEVTTLLDHCGIGVKHGFGVGGNDPKDKIGGIMMLECMKILENDHDIKVVAIVSKPPSPEVERKISNYVASNGSKKYILAFIGGIRGQLANSSTDDINDHNPKSASITKVNSLTSSVLAIAHALGNDKRDVTLSHIYIKPEALANMLEKEWTRLQAGQKYIRALYTGGTFTYEAQVILEEMLDQDTIYSNTPIGRIKELQDSFKSKMNSVVDLGEEEFTQGRPHPMIDPTIRKFRIIEEARDPEIAVILLDFVLGFGSNPDPVGTTLEEIKTAKAIAERDGRYLSIVAHVCATTKDIQGYEQSVSILRKEGCIVMPTNALSVIASAAISSRCQVDLAHIYSKYIELPQDWEEA